MNRVPLHVTSTSLQLGSVHNEGKETAYYSGPSCISEGKKNGRVLVSFTIAIIDVSIYFHTRTVLKFTLQYSYLLFIIMQKELNYVYYSVDRNCASTTIKEIMDPII